MSKEQIVADAIVAITAGQASVLSDAIGAAVDASAAEQKGADGTLSQADVDAAVAKAVLDTQAADAEAIVAAQSGMAALQVSFDALKSSDDALVAKEGQESAAILGLQDSLKAAQEAIAKVFAAFPQP